MTAIKSQNRLFSIVIPTWNNLAFLKLCIQSIQRNSYYNHQIIVHVNDGSDGTLEWIKKAGIDYTHSEQNIGVCFAMNMMRTKVKTDYILFLNDDMYVLPFCIIRKTKCSPLFKRSDISYKTKRPPKNNFPKYSRGSKKSTGKFCFSQCFFL